MGKKLPGSTWGDRAINGGAGVKPVKEEGKEEEKKTAIMRQCPRYAIQM